MSNEEDGWALTESDPAVFTAILDGIGVKGLQVDDIYSLDEATLTSLQPIHALIFLFKWVGGEATKASRAGEVEEEEHDGVYFANQVINNSCGTLAALNAVMNIPPYESGSSGESIEHGTELSNLRDFGAGMDPMTLGHLITNSSLIRQVHNSFTSSSPFAISLDPSIKQKKQDAYHFVTYMPILGELWELDGLRNGPVRHGVVKDGEGWVDRAREVIEKRIGTYPPGSLMFNLVCIRSKAIPRLQRLLSSPSTPTSLIGELSDQLVREQEKERKASLENSLRRHNCIPLVIELLRAMGKSGKLEGAREGAREKGKALRGKEGKEEMEVDD